MYFVSYLFKENDLNIDSINPENARLGWLTQDHIVDVELATSWFHHQQDEDSDIATVPMRLSEWMEDQGDLAMLSQHLADKDVTSLHIGGEPIALPLTQIDWITPIGSTAWLQQHNEKMKMIQLTPLLRSLSFAHTESVSISVAWAGLIGKKGSANSTTWVGAFPCLRIFRGKDTREAWVGAPVLFTSDQWSSEIESITIQIGKQSLTIPLPEVCFRDSLLTNSGEIVVQRERTEPLILSGFEQLDWRIETTGQLMLYLYEREPLTLDHI
ncbi:hypothetical protein SAMN05444392_102476 [Seinonella peptonophila]|uniref:Uncharacterized protein n=1 Tax=Seinonella peptonophila TaxID=112248 RepID=A0A1M4VQR2_9BACL|nr:hypothetical protein [Seinonella peptonophila]SHE71173.1 hypothetical protein SAMN05444392_102476 [Seinonella peptonophila]